MDIAVWIILIVFVVVILVLTLVTSVNSLHKRFIEKPLKKRNPEDV